MHGILGSTAIIKTHNNNTGHKWSPITLIKNLTCGKCMKKEYKVVQVLIFRLKGCGYHCQWRYFHNIPFIGVSMLFSDVCAVTSPKSPTFTDPSKEKKILDGCIREGKAYFSLLFQELILHKWCITRAWLSGKNIGTS